MARMESAIDLGAVQARFPEMERKVVEGVCSGRAQVTAREVYILLCLEEGREHPDALLGIEDKKRDGSETFSEFPSNPSAAAALQQQQRRSSPARSPQSRYDGSNDYTPRLLPSCDWCGRQMNADYLASHLINEHRLDQDKFSRLKKEMSQLRQNNHLSGGQAPVDQEISNGWGEIILKVVVPVMESAQSFSTRIEVIKSLEILIRSCPAFPKAKVYLFGSSVTGLAVQDSDTDVAVDLFGLAQSGVFEPPAEEKRHLDDIYNHLSSARHPFIISNGDPMGPDVGLKKILRTRVPIIGNSPSAESEAAKRNPSVMVRFTSNLPDLRQREQEARQSLLQCGIHEDQATVCTESSGPVLIKFQAESECVRFICQCSQASVLNTSSPPAVYCTRWDMSARLYGVRNSQLLRIYLSEPHLRVAAAAVKIWSKKIKINDPRVGLLSSYAVALMFVYYLIRKGKVAFVNPESINMMECPPFSAFLGNPQPERDQKAQFAEKVGAVFVGFIAFYCFEFDWETEVISLSQPQVVKKSEVGWTASKQILVDRGNSVRYHLCIQDPYERADRSPFGDDVAGMLNVTRKITEYRCLEVHQKFIKTFNIISSQRFEVDKLF